MSRSRRSTTGLDLMMGGTVARRPRGPHPPGGLRRFLWSSVPVWSLGILAWVPFVRLAADRRRPAPGPTARRVAVAAGYALASVAAVVFAVLGNPPHAATSTGLGTAGGFIELTLMIGGALHTWIAFSPAPRYPVYALGDGPGGDDPNTAALASARLAGRRRAEARVILADDPAMARDLKIGRPDLPRTYDDGGLVDPNHVPAELLCGLLGWSPDEAAAVIGYRENVGVFATVEELIAYTEIPPDRVDAVADLLVFRPV